MGRKKITEENKRKTLTIKIPKESYETLDKLGIKNKSKLFNWLLEQHFGTLNN